MDEFFNNHVIEKLAYILSVRLTDRLCLYEYVLLGLASISWLLFVLFIYDRLVAKLANIIIATGVLKLKSGFKLISFKSISVNYLKQTVQVSDCFVDLGPVGSCTALNLTLQLNHTPRTYFKTVDLIFLKRQLKSQSEKYLARKKQTNEIVHGKLYRLSGSFVRLILTDKSAKRFDPGLLKEWLVYVNNLLVSVHKSHTNLSFNVNFKTATFAYAQLVKCPEQELTYLLPKMEDRQQTVDVLLFKAASLTGNLCKHVSKRRSTCLSSKLVREFKNYPVLTADSVKLNVYPMAGLNSVHQVNVTVNSSLCVNIDPWNNLSTFLVDLFQNNINFRLGLTTQHPVEVNVCNKTDIVLKLTMNGDSCPSYACSIDVGEQESKLSFDNVKVSSFLNEQLLLDIDRVELQMHTNKLDDRLDLKINLGGENRPTQIGLNSFVITLGLLTQLTAKLTTSYLKNLNVSLVLLSINEIWVKYGAGLVFKTDRFSLKMNTNRTMETRTALAIFDRVRVHSTVETRQTIEINCEKVCVEWRENADDARAQCLFSPIKIEKCKNLNGHSHNGGIMVNQTNTTELLTIKSSYDSYLYTFAIDDDDDDDDASGRFSLNLESENRSSPIEAKTLYLSVVQIRFEAFKHKNKVYSNQIELVLGDVFGTIELNQFEELMNLFGSIYGQVGNELELNETLSDHLGYSSFRILTSLIHVNLLMDRKESTTGPSDLLVFNLVVSPLHYGSCDFHMANDVPSSLLVVPDLSIKFLRSSNDADDFVEFSSVQLKHILMSRVVDEQKETTARRINHLKQNDHHKKRLAFMWNYHIKQPGLKCSFSGCACTGHGDFFSKRHEQLYDFSSSSLFYKPCVLQDSPASLGRSLLDADEFALFSYRKYFPEYRHNVLLPLAAASSSKSFLVLSHLETQPSTDVKAKFELEKIFVLDCGTDELNEFINESSVKKNSSASNQDELNRACMWPPYFSADFKLYIRYLPLIRNISAIKLNQNESKLTLEIQSTAEIHSDLQSRNRKKQTVSNETTNDSDNKPHHYKFNMNSNTKLKKKNLTDSNKLLVQEIFIETIYNIGTNQTMVHKSPITHIQTDLNLFETNQLCVIYAKLNYQKNLNSISPSHELVHNYLRPLALRLFEHKIVNFRVCKTSLVLNDDHVSTIDNISADLTEHSFNHLMIKIKTGNVLIGDENISNLNLDLAYTKSDKFLKLTLSNENELSVAGRLDWLRVLFFKSKSLAKLHGLFSNYHLLVNLAKVRFEFKFRAFDLTLAVDDLAIEYSNVFTVRKSKFKLTCNLTARVIDKKHPESSVTINVSLVKKLLDGHLILDVNGGLKFDVRLPLIVDAKLDDESVHVPLIGITASSGSNVRQLVEISSVDVDIKALLGRRLARLSVEKLRVMQASFLTDENLLNRLDELRLEEAYSVRLDVNELVYCYFPDKWINENWIYVKLVHFQLEYAPRLDQLAEEFKVTFREQFTNGFAQGEVKNEDNLNLTRSVCLWLEPSSPGGSLKIWEKFDFSRWLDYAAMESRQQYSYMIKPICKLCSARLKFVFELKHDHKQATGKLNNHWANKEISVESTANGSHSSTFYLNEHLFRKFTTKIIDTLFEQFSAGHSTTSVQLASARINITVREIGDEKLIDEERLNFLPAHKICFLMRHLFFSNITNFVNFLNLIKESD